MGAPHLNTMKTYPSITDAAAALEAAQERVVEAKHEAREVKEACIKLIVEAGALSLLDVRLSAIRARRHHI